MTGNRRESRILALKLLYSLELNDEDLTLAKFDSFRNDFNINNLDYAEELFNSTVENITKIDEQLINIIDNWSFERVSVVDKCLLRLACEEMSLKLVPVNVVINEIIEISKIFGDSKSSIFINGILDNWRKKYL